MNDKEIIELQLKRIESQEKYIKKLESGMRRFNWWEAEIKPRQRKTHWLPEWVTEEDIEYRIIDRKLGKIFLLLK